MRLTINLSKDLAEDLTIIARRQGITKGQLIEILIRRGLNESVELPNNTYGIIKKPKKK